MQPCSFNDKSFVKLCCKGACSICRQEWFHNLAKASLNKKFLKMYYIFLHFQPALEKKRGPQALGVPSYVDGGESNRS